MPTISTTSVVFGLSFSGSQSDFEGFLQVLGFLPHQNRLVPVSDVTHASVNSFTIFLHPHPIAFGQLICFHTWEFDHCLKKMLMPGANAQGVNPGGGGNGHCWNSLMYSRATSLLVIDY